MALKVRSGNLRVSIQSSPNNPQLKELQGILNEMFDTLGANIKNVITTLQLFAKNDLNSSIQKHGLQGEMKELIEGVNARGSSLQRAQRENHDANEQITHSAKALNDTVEEITNTTIVDFKKMVTKIVSSIHTVAAKENDMVTSLEALVQNANETKAIMDTIGDIAEQTNLLALNAAIEAARAGDGRAATRSSDATAALPHPDT